MSSSSISRAIAEVEKSKKVERRNAIEKGEEPENGQQQHKQVDVGGVPTEASDSDSPVAVKKAPEKKASVKKKSPAKKASKKS
ncbi:hypothetical protein OAE49_06360 [Gammaproteobacteria bacterium]|nr:hypothetical protein [Gammaproteobacteria bacterium]